MRLYRDRLGPQTSKQDLKEKILEVLEHRSPMDFSARKLGDQVSLTLDEKHRLGIHHIRAHDQSDESLRLERAFKRTESNRKSQRRARAKKKAQTPMKRESPRTAAVRASVTGPTTMSELCRRLETHDAFITRDGEVIARGAMRMAVSRALNMLEAAGELESETRMCQAGHLERYVAPKRLHADIAA